MDRREGQGHRGNRNQSPDRKRKRDGDDKRDDRLDKKRERGDRDERPSREDRSHLKEDRTPRSDRGYRDDRSNRQDRTPRDSKEDRRQREEKVQKEPITIDDRDAGKKVSTGDSSPRQDDGEASPAADKAPAKNWRDEVAEDAPELSDDEAEQDRKMAEARKRRQELMKKAAGKRAEEKKDDPAADTKSPDSKAKDDAEAEELKAAAAKKAEQEDTGGMFDDSAAAGDELLKQVKQTAAIGFTGASGEDWDDEEGYYVPKLDELMDDRYLVLEVSAGKGVYSGVVKCQDKRRGPDAVVAVKVIRANDRMTKAAELEVALLKRLNSSDRDGLSHIIRLFDTFVYRQHFCLVFEAMWGDLRSAVKTFTKNRGMTLLAVRSYTKQLLSGLRHMLNCKIIHCDIKPDNILISKGHNAVKFCDFGTAVEISGVNATPYLGSGYYRSPEIVLGCEWAYPVDTWALASTLAEIFTGKVLMPSKSNNQHLKMIMELKGKIPGKVIKKGNPLVWQNHFTADLDFKLQEESKMEDSEEGTVVTRTITDLSAKRSLKDICMDRVGPEKRQSDKFEDREYVTRATQFADLLELMFTLDPDKRVSPSDALQHAFCQDLGKKKN